MPIRLSERRAAWLILGLIGLLFVLASSLSIPRQEIEKDEFISSSVIRADSANALIQERIADGHVPLYFLGLRAWTQLFGHVQSSMIAFSVLLALLTLPVMWLLARELGLGRWAYLAALLLALHPAFQFFAHFVRPYSGLLLIDCLVLLVVARLLRRPLHGTGAPSALFVLAAYALALVGAAWHHLVLITWVCLLLAVLLLPALRRRTRPALWGLFVVAVAAHGAVLVVLKTLLGSADRKPLEWARTLPWYDTLDEVIKIIGGRAMTVLDPKSYHLAALFAVLAVGWTIYREGRALVKPPADAPVGDPLPSLWLAVAGTAVMPLIAMTALSYGAGRPVLFERYMLPILPGILLCTVRVMKGLRPGWVRVGVLLLIGVLWLQQSRKVLDARETGLRDAVARLEAVVDMRRGDGLVLFNQFAREAIDLYGHGTLEFYQQGSAFKPLRYMREIEPYLAGRERVWMMLYRERGNVHRSEPWRARVGRPVQVEEFKKVRIELFLPPAQVAVSTGTLGTTTATLEAARQSAADAEAEDAATDAAQPSSESDEDSSH